MVWRASRGRKLSIDIPTSPDVVGKLIYALNLSGHRATLELRFVNMGLNDEVI